jgi:hypothetical protein
MTELKISTDGSYPDIWVYLFVRRFDCSPDDITELLGIAPTKTWRVGEKIYETGTITRKDNGWQLGPIRKSRSESVESQVTALMGTVGSAAERFSRLPPESAVVLFCAVYMTSAPAVGFTAEQVAFLSRIGAAIEFDLYCMTEAPS